MDADTIFRCFLEIKNSRQHWRDVVPLMREEFESSSSIQTYHREILLQLLIEVEVDNSGLARREAISSEMFEILQSYPAFVLEFCDYVSRRITGYPDDRRID